LFGVFGISKIYHINTTEYNTSQREMITMTRERHKLIDGLCYKYTQTETYIGPCKEHSRPKKKVGAKKHEN